jgi:hypothetical protein
MAYRFDAPAEDKKARIAELEATRDDALAKIAKIRKDAKRRGIELAEPAPAPPPAAKPKRATALENAAQQYKRADGAALTLEGALEGFEPHPKIERPDQRQDQKPARSATDPLARAREASKKPGVL